MVTADTSEHSTPAALEYTLLERFDFDGEIESPPTTYLVRESLLWALQNDRTTRGTTKFTPTHLGFKGRGQQIQCESIGFNL